MADGGERCPLTLDISIQLMSVMSVSVEVFTGAEGARLLRPKHILAPEPNAKKNRSEHTSQFSSPAVPEGLSRGKSTHACRLCPL